MRGVRPLHDRELVLDQVAQPLVCGIHRDRRIRSGRCAPPRLHPRRVARPGSGRCGGGGSGAARHRRISWEQNCAACHAHRGGQALARHRRREPVRTSTRRVEEVRRAIIDGRPGHAEGPGRRRRRRRRGRLRRRRRRRGERTLPPGLDPASVRAVAMDLDRTILADDLEFSPRDGAGGGAASARPGIAAIIATGRMFASARPYALQLGVTAPVICYQGALVADPRTGEWLLHRPMDVAARARGDRGGRRRAGFHMNVYVDDQLYVEKLNDEALTYADARAARGASPSATSPRGSTSRRPRSSSSASPSALDDLQARLRSRFDDRALHRQVAADLPRARAPGRVQGRRRSSSCASGSASTRPRWSRSATGRTTSSCSRRRAWAWRSPTPTRRCSTIADWTVPPVERGRGRGLPGRC